MTDQRRTAEEFLAKIKAEEDATKTGKLKIFLGSAAGVGKTYKMLESARELIGEGVDVVAGCVVTHGRKETESLLAGLEILPPRIEHYKGTQQAELDLDGALKRAPSVLLIDELAHTNAPNSRHQKRWQDVEELLEAGIHVYTTLNIQHLESANDIVSQITRVIVRETVPDSFFEKAYEVELVDLPPDELIQRLKDGKVYVGDQSARALEHFFRKGNLIALRELALRSTAERVDKQMQKYRSDESIKELWPASDRIMVCVGPSPLSARVVRSARRIASRLNAEWLAVYVETPVYARLSKRDRMRLIRTLRLAESLGAHTAVLTGTNVTEELVTFARKKNISRILIGKPARPRWHELLFGSVTDALIRRSGEIEIDVLSGDGEPQDNEDRALPPQKIDFDSYAKALLIIALATIVARAMHETFALVNLVMIYQLAVVWISVRYGRGPSLMSAIVSVLACDFFFVPPYYSFAVTDTQYLVTLLTMLVVALTLSSLTQNIRHQAEIARQRERRTAALYAMTRELAAAATKDEVVDVAAKHLKELFESSIVFCLADLEHNLEVLKNVDGAYEMDAHELGVAQWVFSKGQVAGSGTATLPGARAVYLPLRGSARVIGAIGVRSADSTRLLHPEEMHLLEIFVNQIALAIERATNTERSLQAYDRKSDEARSPEAR